MCMYSKATNGACTCTCIPSTIIPTFTRYIYLLAPKASMHVHK